MCCDKYQETIDDLISSRTTVAMTEYKFWHDTVGQYLRLTIFNFYGRETTINCYDQPPPPDAVTEIGHITTLWDFTINTSKSLKANHPNIVCDLRPQRQVVSSY